MKLIIQCKRPTHVANVANIFYHEYYFNIIKILLNFREEDYCIVHYVVLVWQITIDWYLLLK